MVDVVLHHIGYVDAEFRKQKLNRDRRLLLMEFQEQPNDPFTLFNLGGSYLELNQQAEALTHLRRSL
jgi:hypothetical protein